MELPGIDTIATLLSRRASRRSAFGRLGAGGLAVAGGVGLARVSQAQEATPPPANGGLPSFRFGLEAAKAKQLPAGLVRWASLKQFPVLKGIALASIVIDPGGLRELHWHANAHELNYCLSGQGEMAVVTPNDTLETFNLSAGSVSFAPMGFTHYIRNTGTEPLLLALAFTHEQPTTFDFSASLPVVPRNLLAETFGVATSTFPAITNRGDQSVVSLNSPPAGPAPTAGAGLPPKPYTVNISQVNPAVFGGGTVYSLGRREIPRLDGITVWPLHGKPHSLREPHWHPNAAELDYCISGSAQIGLIAPDGKQQTFTVGPGDVAFIPTNWFHYIASVSDDPLELLVFFDDPEPQHLDLSQTVARFPPEIFAASFGIDSQAIAALPKRGDVVLAGASAAATPTP